MSPARSTRIDAALRAFRHEATETFSASDWKFQSRELVVVRLDLDEFQDRDRRTLNGIALMERAKVGGATAKLKMRLHSPVMFERPVELSELPAQFRGKALYSTSVNVRRIDAARVSDAEGSLVHGITLGRAHLDSFLNLPQSTQLGSGKRIGYGNCHRYLSTSQFVELAEAGWFGGGAGAYAFMQRLLQANQSGGRQTLLAFVSQAENLDEVNRGWWR